MTTIVDIVPKEVEVREGLQYILSHTDGLWPRTISTYFTRGSQILVNSIEEAMALFKDSNFIDCRISAYPKYTDFYIERTGIAPTVLRIDVDKEHFRTIEDFELAVTNTYNNFYTKLGSRPTQLATGGGVHFLTPQKAPVFEKLPRFEKFREPSRKFMQFEERLFSNEKADESHWRSVSFNNMLLRIPGTLNYSCFRLDDRGKIIDIPYEAKVRVVREWDGNIPIVNKSLIMQYYAWLQLEIIKNIREQNIREQNRKCYGRSIDIIYLHNYGYIDRLYDKPIGDFRGFCIWRIFVPYFINVKRLSALETSTKINNWLSRCNSIKRLSFRPEPKIKYAINHVSTYCPPWKDSLEQINKPFYELLKTEGIIIDRVTN